MSEPSLQSAGDERESCPLPPAPDGISIDLTAIEGLPRAAQRKAWTASLVAALTGHAAVLLYFALPPQEDAVAISGLGLEAIDIEIVSAAVLESRGPGTQALSTPPSAVESADPGVAAAEATAAAADQKESTAEARPAPAGPTPDLVIPDAKEEEPPPEPAEVALSIAKSRAEQPDDQRPENEPEQTDAQEPESATRSQPSDSSDDAVEGAASVRGTVSPQSRAASEYTKAVIETLAGRKPRAKAGMRGTVWIRFTVVKTGEVSNAHVLTSSGSKTLDDAALAAVRGAKFPTPVLAEAETGLIYNVPYIFR